MRRANPILTLAAALALFAACAGPAKEDVAMMDAGPVRVVFRQYYKGSRPVILESIGGRDPVKLRSKPLRGNEAHVKYVDDEVMLKLLESFRDFGFFEFARARPGDPTAYGARAELTLIRSNSRTISFIRQAGQGQRAGDAYGKCVRSVMAVDNFTYSLQASKRGGDGEFGIHRAEKD